MPEAVSNVQYDVILLAPSKKVVEVGIEEINPCNWEEDGWRSEPNQPRQAQQHNGCPFVGRHALKYMIMVAKVHIDDASIDLFDEVGQNGQHPTELFVRQVVVLGIDWPEILPDLLLCLKSTGCLHKLNG